MPQVVKIGVGGAYSTVASWVASSDYSTDWGAGNPATGQITGKITEVVTINTATTPNGALLTAFPGEEYDGANSATCAGLVSTGITLALRDDGLEVSNIFVETTGNTICIRVGAFEAVDTNLHDMGCKAGLTGNDSAGIETYASAAFTGNIVNFVVEASGGWGLRLRNSTTGTIDHVTLVDCAANGNSFRDGIQTANNSTLVTNVFIALSASASGSAQCFSGSYSASSDFNAGGDTTAPGSNSLDNRTTVDLANYAGGDFRTASASALATAGSGGGFIGAFLETSSGISITVTEDGPSFVESISATTTPSAEQRVFIALNNPVDSDCFTANQWAAPTGVFRIKTLFAIGNVERRLFKIGELAVSLGGGAITVYHDIGAGSDTSWQTRALISAMSAGDLHSLEIVGDVATQKTTSIILDGVTLAFFGTQVIRPFGFGGGISIGCETDGTDGWTGHIADFSLTDEDSASNSFEWFIDLPSGNNELSQVNTKDLAYINVSGGLPARELFTLNGAGTQWDGNNSTTLTIAYPVATGVLAIITEDGPGFTDSVVTIVTGNVTAAITETGPSFSESIAATLSGLAITVDLTETGPSFIEVIASELDVNINAIIAEQGPSFNENVGVEIAKDITVTITESGPSFTETIFASIPFKITVNPRNVIRVKRKSNSVTVKRKSNSVTIKRKSNTIRVR